MCELETKTDRVCVRDRERNRERQTDIKTKDTHIKRKTDRQRCR